MKFESDKNRALSTVSTIISSSLGGQGANQVVSPYTAYAIGQYFKHNEALNQRDLEQTGEKGTRAEQGSASHLLAHGLLAAATSYATGQSPATITTATITTMGAEALAPKLSQYLYGTEKVADLNTEQKQTISNVLGTVGLVAGAVTAQATGADSMNSVSAGQQVQDGVVNAIDNNWLSKEDINSLIKDYNQKIIDCEIQGKGNCSLEKKKLIMTEIMEQGREKSLQNNQILDDICKTNKSLCSEKIKNMKDSLAFSLNNLNSDLINDSYIKNFDNLNQNIQDLLSDNTPVSRIIIVQAEYDDKSRINEVTSLQDLNTYENLSSLMLYSDENTKETIYNYLRNRSFNGTNQKAETGRLWKDFSLWVSEKRDERLYDDYENINSVPNLIANSTLQTTELTKMSGKNRGINIIKGAGDAGISVVVKTGEWITNIPDILKEQVNTITNTDYVEAVSDIAKNHTFKEDVKKLYTNAVDATTNLFEDADKMFTSDKNSEVIPASQNATEFTAGVIGAFIPVNKATKAINITKAPDKTPTSSSDTPSKTEHKSQNSFDKEKVLANLENSQKARDSSNFNDYTNSENVRRIEYDSKLTTTVDGNLSVTHGVSYTDKSIFNNYSEKTKIQITDIDEQAEFLSKAVNGLPKEQAKVILEIAKNSNTSVVFGGSRVRGDFHDGSDIDIGFGHINANKAGKIIKKINDKSQNINGALNPEPTRIVPNNETPNIQRIESPEEFFQRSGVRADKDEKAGQPYVPSGSITVDTDGTITIIPPKK